MHHLAFFRAPCEIVTLLRERASKTHPPVRPSTLKHPMPVVNKNMAFHKPFQQVNPSILQYLKPA